MKFTRTIISALICVLWAVPSAVAFKGVLASPENILKLKKDVLEGKIDIGRTRMMNIQNEYGEAPNIIDDDKRVTYDYGDLRLTFDRQRLLKDWEKDSFRDPVYTESANDLRFDLESGELVGDNITLQVIRRSYGEPTESYESDGDGERSVYYFGDIKLIFENVISVKSWRGANLGEGNQTGVDTSDVFQSSTPPVAPSEITSEK